ncbi:ABC transporter ATP-binding protein [Candidatus Aerophobetes bacterium]|uniref:ABC transporter ATP-binding protein n=1 Tax=Aerophobetes bacterium TaxID=2030807 RepID=A0A2A4YMA4_UNCAE|nr:MAG: ABC transporter ATP-binding protein [Candidatus Aerophobetes bacterium]
MEIPLPPLISCKSISKSYGLRDLFRDLSVSFSPGDRVGLIGPNGAGKSTLLNLFAKLDSPDTGEIVHSKSAHIGYVPQHIEKHSGTVQEVLEDALINDTHIDESNRERHIRRILGQVGLADPAQLASELSGGRTRRLAIAKALVNEPNILLLDEPTNHLDLDTILWLESFLKRSFKTFIVTSHDRAFLDTISSKIWELSHRYPKGIFSVDGGYVEFIKARENFLMGQEKYERSLRSKTRREEEWLKQSPKARSTKAKARIQEAARLQHELANVKFRNTESKTELGFSSTDRKTKILLTAKNISKEFEGKKIFSEIDIRLVRGDRIAIVGDNGSGKTTLLKILAGEINSDSGTIKYADGLKIFYFDQHRESLDLNLSLRDALSPNGDTIIYRGSSIHIYSWCKKFLFDKSRLDLPIKLLSGGERARVLIARLMMQPVDLLLLDEPTNDLDIDTLEILEASLDDFPGSVVLISHDRAIIDRVADNLVALDSNGGHSTFNDTEAWLQHRKKCALEKSREPSATKTKTSVKKTKLSYKEKKELAKMEETLTALGEEIDALSAILADPAIQNDTDALQQTCQNLANKQEEVDEVYRRWQELEDKT